MGLLDKAKKSGPSGGLFSKARLYVDAKEETVRSPEADSPRIARDRVIKKTEPKRPGPEAYSSKFPERICSLIGAINDTSACWAYVLDILYEETGHAPVFLYRRCPQGGYTLFARATDEASPIELPETLRNLRLDEKRDGFLNRGDIAAMFGNVRGGLKERMESFSGMTLPGTPSAGFVLIGLEEPESGLASARTKTALAFAVEKISDSFDAWGTQKGRFQDIGQEIIRKRLNKHAFQAEYEIQSHIPESVTLSEAAYSCLHEKVQKMLTSKGFIRENDRAHGTMVFLAKDRNVDTELILIQVKKSFKKMTDARFDLAFRSPKFILLGEPRPVPTKS